jgi:hypothetical protein
MRMNTDQLAIHEIGTSLQFIQGFRYLDRCGEAMIRLQSVLDHGWVTAEAIPTSGVMRNDSLGMQLRFNSDGISVRQTDFFDFQAFFDQACKAAAAIISVLGVERINVPTLQAVFQRAFDETEAADAYLRQLRYCTPASKLLDILDGEEEAATYVLCVTKNVEWAGQHVRRRRRFNANAVIQARQPPFDERLIRRVRQLPTAQQEAMKALLKIRQTMPAVSHYAAQIDLEHTFEAEFSWDMFDFPAFVEQGWLWTQGVLASVPLIAED